MTSEESRNDSLHDKNHQAVIIIAIIWKRLYTEFFPLYVKYYILYNFHIHSMTRN